MKPAEEWTKKLTGSKFIDDIAPNSLRINADYTTVNFIKQIQLDAWQQGMKDAYEIVRLMPSTDDSMINQQVAEHAILTQIKITTTL